MIPLRLPLPALGGKGESVFVPRRRGEKKKSSPLERASASEKGEIEGDKISAGAYSKLILEHGAHGEDTEVTEIIFFKFLHSVFSVYPP